MGKDKTIIKWIFWPMFTIFLLFILFLAFPFSDTLRHTLFSFVAVLAGLFLILSIILLIKSKKQKIKLRYSLRIAGASAIGIPVFTILHNLFYGIGMYFNNISFIRYSMEFLHVTSFILSLLVCPVIFLVSAIMVIIFLRE